MFSILASELKTAMQLSGVTQISDINSSFIVNHPKPKL
jgi:isopentenyl diphosphate isomerase/L-lactate dehydrogenase-like FMN-dependent dehydrogenase